MKSRLHAQLLKTGLICGLLLASSACAIFEGTEAWCDLMEKKDKTDCTLNDAKIYGQECLLDDD